MNVDVGSILLLSLFSPPYSINKSSDEKDDEAFSAFSFVPRTTAIEFFSNFFGYQENRIDVFFFPTLTSAQLLMKGNRRQKCKFF
jgi:hypothetical protein